MFSTSGSLTINEFGTLIVNENATLRIGVYLNVDEGTLEVLGSPCNNRATITRNNIGNDYYTFHVQHGTIRAEWGIFEYMDVYGIMVYSSNIDPDYAFNHCTFKNGEPGGTLLSFYYLDLPLTCTGAWFPQSVSSYNVFNENNFGHVITFEAPHGIFSGPKYEDDEWDLIDWNYQPFPWSGLVSTDWGNCLNWDYYFVPEITDDVAVPTGISVFHPKIIKGSKAYCNNIDIETGTSLEIDSADLYINNNCEIYGTFVMNHNARLKMVDSSGLNVNTGGVFEIIGSPGNEAIVTNDSVGTYNFNVYGTIAAEYAIFENMGANGLNVRTTGTVDPAHTFNNCMFRNGAPAPSTLLTLNNDQVFTSNNVYFENTFGNTEFNVRKEVDFGEVTFDAPTGDFAGPEYKDDPYNRIHWTHIDIELDPVVILQGAFNITDMNTTLNDNGVLPLNQPYNTAPWNYAGTESVASIPNPNIVDWVLVELRDATDASLATPETKIAQQAAFLLKDGSIVGLDGSSILQFNISWVNELFLAIWHRNHLGIMSANPLIQSKGNYTYNFTSGNTQAFGTDAQKFLGGGLYGMIGGDGDANGLVDIYDKDPLWNLEAGTQGYVSSDYNMDLHSNNLDKDDIWNPNFGSTGQVPGGYGFTCGDLLLDDRDAQSYQTVLIGTQCWMAENLNIGTMVNGSSNQIDNAVIEKYCYSDNTSNCDTYGGMYQWNEMMQYSTAPGVQGICPTGWKLPTDGEWKTLEMELGMTQAQADALGWRGTDEGGKLKETGTTHWSSPNTGATNTSGFTGLPGGIRQSSSFSNLTNFSYFWSSTSTSSDTKAWDRLLGYNTSQVHRDDNGIALGFSVRCVKN